MKLSVITDEIDSDLERALQVAKEFPIEQVELRTLWGVNIAEADEETLARARQVLHREGLGVCSIASPVFKTDLFGVRERGAMHGASEQSLEKHFELLQRCLQIARFFGAPLVRLFAFWRAGELTPEREERIIEVLTRVLPFAERAGVILGLENEHSCQVGTGAELAQVLQRIDSPWLRAVWDPGNAFVLGEAAEAGYAAIQPWVIHIHAKDGIRQSDGTVRWVIIGEGEIGYPQHLAQIARSGYSGFISLETHARVEGLTQAEVSRRCLHALQKLITANTQDSGGSHVGTVG
ncbi:MAG: sugar phosphate isomerase/epimerase family protein [Armatimonadota bacterium]